MLIHAAFNGDNDEIRRLIKAGANIMATDECGETALHNAACMGYIETCAMIISEYANSVGDVKKLIAAKNHKEDENDEEEEDGGNTALHIAAYNGYVKVCRLLIDEYAKAGGNVKKLIAKTNDGFSTALHDAATNVNRPNSESKICALLIEKYAEAGGEVRKLIAIKDVWGRTAQQRADGNECIKTAKFLKSIKKLIRIMEKEALGSFMKSFTECVAA